MIRIYSIQARLCFIIEYGSPAPASASGGRGASAGADGRCAIDPAEDMLCLLYVAEQQWLLIERKQFPSRLGARPVAHRTGDEWRHTQRGARGDRHRRLAVLSLQPCP